MDRMISMLESLGIPVYCVNGSIRNVTEIIDDLAVLWIAFTEAEKQNAMSKLMEFTIEQTVKTGENIGLSLKNASNHLQ